MNNDSESFTEPNERPCVREKCEDGDALEEAEALLNELFEQADQATPRECRDNVFRDVMQSVEDFLIKQGTRVSHDIPQENK